MHKSYDGARVLVTGGCIGGLTAGLLLQVLGFAVTIFERSSSELDGRGGGIVLQPEMLRWFKERSHLTPADVSTATEWLRYLGPGNEILHEEPADWSYSSWSTLYSALLYDFSRADYVLGEPALDFIQDSEAVEVRFASAGWLGTVLSKEVPDVAKTAEMEVRSMTGAGAERPSHTLIFCPPDFRRHRSRSRPHTERSGGSREFKASGESPE